MPISNTHNKQRFNHALDVGGALIVIIITFLIVYLGSDVKTHVASVSAIKFKPFTDSNITAILSSMLVVAIFMERSVEALLTPIRAPDREILEQELAAIQKEPVDSNIQTKKEQEIAKYKLHTARHAYWISYIFGLIISIIGIRILDGLVDPQDLKNLKDLNKVFFTFIDVMLTGSVIAGGSAAIDKIGRGISDYFNLKSAIDSKISKLDKNSS